jgi:hypothetical protein
VDPPIAPAPRLDRSPQWAKGRSAAPFGAEFTEIEPADGDRAPQRVGTVLDRASIRIEAVLAKWLGKPTCEHAMTQTRLGPWEHAAASITLVNSHVIS